MKLFTYPSQIETFSRLSEIGRSTFRTQKELFCRQCQKNESVKYLFFSGNYSYRPFMHFQWFSRLCIVCLPGLHNSNKVAQSVNMRKTNKISTVSASIKKNRLYITLQGVIHTKEAERLYTDIRFCVSDLEPGFAVITDLTQCRIGHLSAIGIYSKIINFLQEKQVGQIVRIIGDAKIIYLQMMKLTDKFQNYEPKYFPTLGEAEVFLDESLLENPVA